MKLGLYGINVAACVDPDVAARTAQLAEAAGFESVWTAEHVVLPDPQAPPSPLPPLAELLDPAVSLAFIAAHTERLKLATGIVILSQRNPVVLAKEFCSVDRLSKGRLVFGVAAGYLQAEMESIGAEFESRGRRTDEFIDAVKELWTSDAPSHRGEFVRFEGIQQRPQPVQKPHPPIVLGGQSAPAFRRAQARGDGWYGFAMNPDVTERMLEGLEAQRAASGRAPDAGRLEISITPPGPLDVDSVERYAELGVDRLVVLGVGNSPDRIKGVIDASVETCEKAGCPVEV